MAILHVQDAALGSNSNGSSQQTSAFAAQPTVGNYLVAWGWGWVNIATAVGNLTFSDTGANAYTKVGFQTRSADLWCCMAYAKVATAGASFKVTLANAQGGGSIMVCAAEFSGVQASTPEDGAAVGTTGTTGAPAPGSKTITAGSLVCAVMVNDGSGTVTVTTPAGFTSVGKQTSGTFEVGDGCYAINPASPTNPTWNSGTVAWGASQFALLAAGGAAFTWQPLTAPEVPVRDEPWAIDYQFARPGARAPGQFGPGWRPRRSWRPQGRLLVPEVR